MRSNISISAGNISLSIDLPWEVAELLVEHGPAVLKDISAALEADRTSNPARQKTLALKDKDISVRKQRWTQVARALDQQLRKSGATGKDATRIVRETAAEFGLPVGSLRAIHRVYCRERAEKIRARRDAQVLRLHLLGHTNREIAFLISPQITPQSVGRILDRYPDVIGSLREFDNRRQSGKSAENSHSGSSRELPEPDGSTAQQSQEARQTFIKDRIEHHRKLGIQFYRLYRKTKPSKGARRAFHERLADPHDFPGIYAEHLISKRRFKVKKYIEARRLASVARLVAEGKKNQEIADKLCISKQTVYRHTRELKRQRLFPFHKRGIIR